MGAVKTDAATGTLNTFKDKEIENIGSTLSTHALGIATRHRTSAITEKNYFIWDKTYWAFNTIDDLTHQMNLPVASHGVSIEHEPKT